jgi:hypothetical protein
MAEEIVGEFTPEELTQIQEWIAAHWTRSECPFHGPTRWQLGKLPAEAPSGATLDGRGQAYPLIAIICRTCGYTVFLNSVIVGVKKAGTQTESEAPRPAE